MSLYRESVFGIFSEENVKMKGKRREKKVWFQCRRESCCNELEENYNYDLRFSLNVKMLL